MFGNFDFITWPFYADINERTGYKESPLRWEVMFNLTITRMVSFGMDLHWKHFDVKTLSPEKVNPEEFIGKIE